jgi:predicted SnoaL-like aldol condensation-catalyzing enzyme
MRFNQGYVLLAAMAFGGAVASAPAAAKLQSTSDVSPTQKVVELLSSIETGAPEPVAYINANKYIQHNLAVKDGLAGFGEIMSQLPEGSAKARVVRAFQDGDYVVAHTEYNFFGPKIGFDIFRFEEGKIVEHWDTIEPIPAQAQWKNDNGKF